MMRNLLILMMFASFLMGCAGKPFMTLGDKVGAPSGAVDYCKRHPVDALCK